MEDISKLTPYLSPVHPRHFGRLSLTLMVIGFILFSWFIVYEVNVAKKNRSLLKEVVVSAAASCFLGFGLIFMIMWGGIFV